MTISPVLSAERISDMSGRGLWRDKVLLDFLDQHAEERPAAAAIVDSGQNRRITYGQLREVSRNIADNLAALGVRAGDVVSVQLPNWWQLTAIHLACLMLRAITNPLMPSLRERELKFMLNRTKSKILVVPKSFRNFDYVDMCGRIRAGLPNLTDVVVIGPTLPDGVINFDLQLAQAACQVVAKERPSPNDVIQILFTSGTTGEPKGVLHISNTILSHSIAMAERMELTSADTVLTATPMTHQTGFLYGLQMPIVLGAKSVLQESWSPVVALDLIAAEEVTFSMGATPFLADLSGNPKAAQAKGRLKTFISGGAPIPPALARRATDVLGAKIIAIWGMTENGAVTTTLLDDPEEKIFGTDGVPMPGMEIRVVDDKGAELPQDQVGFLECRGPNNFVGYLGKPDIEDMDENGWFDTGDLARIDRDGYVRITGRAKDMIIRGGENIPVVEVESVLLQHPAIERVALVAMPDERLGERGCAFVTLNSGSVFALSELRQYLAEQQMMRGYWPERVEVVDKMPMTESGKIQKAKLREIAKSFVV
jgi:cyclohexanecarboxylate-CoA ligase